MSLPPDTVSLLLVEIGKEFAFYNDLLLTCGFIYVSKTVFCISWSAFKGFREHVWTKLIPNRDSVTSLGKYAVVTGATEQMGRAFAEELAGRGMNLILIDKNIFLVKELASVIEREYSIETRCFSIDYDISPSTFGTLQEILEASDIGVLVNCHQKLMLTPAPFVTMNLATIKDMIDTNITCVSFLTKVVLKGMLRRNRGVVLNLSSFSAIWPIPFITPYSASKAYVDFFSRALNSECRGTDVRVQTVVSGVIKPDAFKDDENSVFSAMVPSLSTFVRNTIDSIMLPQSITGYWVLSLQIWVLKQVPNFILERVIYEVMSAASKG